MFQVCPICKGTGWFIPSVPSINTSIVCSTCDGKKIINTETGLPPKDKK